MTTDLAARPAAPRRSCGRSDRRQPLARVPLALLAALALAACAGEAPPPPVAQQAMTVSSKTQAMYSAMADGDEIIPAIDPRWLTEDKARQEVAYHAPFAAGTIVVDPRARFLYHLKGGGRAGRDAVAVGPEGYGFSGEASVPFQRAWPDWRPTANMIRRSPEKYAQYAAGVPGGLGNPLGARALYLFRGGRDTYYRIHGTTEPWSIGQATSAGCIRLFNQDIIHLADQVTAGTRVVVLRNAESGRWTRPQTVLRLPPA